MMKYIALLLSFLIPLPAMAAITVCPQPSDKSKCITFETEQEYESWRASREAEFRAEAKPLGDSIYQIALVVLSAQAVAKDSVAAGHESAHYYVSVMGRDMPARYSKELTSPRIFPESRFSSGRGVLISFNRFEPMSDGRVLVQWSTYCDRLCATSNTAVVKKVKGDRWVLIKSALNWISRINAKNKLDLTALRVATGGRLAWVLEVLQPMGGLGRYL